MVRVEVTLHAKVAALYIDPRGPYPRMAAGWLHAPDGSAAKFQDGRAIDCYDATRDARLYGGPHPVVAHPPCKHWGRLRHLAKDAECWHCRGSGRHVDPQWAKGWVRCGGCAGTGRVSDRDCAPRAVEQVRAFGGVLEHPAGSMLWQHPFTPSFAEGGLIVSSALPMPGESRDRFDGYTIEVDQCEWGHVARKRTWLYLVGVPREALEAPPFPGREPTRSVSGKRGRPTQAKHLTWKEQLPRASDAQRRRTPPLLAEYLVRLARAVRRP